MKQCRPLFVLIILYLLVLQPSVAQTVPPYQVIVTNNPPAGYYFLCPIKVGQNPGGITPTHLILDQDGDVLYMKQFTGIQNTGDFKLQQNGLISYSHMGKFFLMDSTFMVIDSVNCQNGINTDTHDMQMLPNGNFLVMGIENVIMDLSGYSLFGPNHNLPGNTNATVQSVVIQELDVNKNVIFDWRARDYYSFDDVDVVWLNNPAVVDWTHSNAIEKDTDGNYLLSNRHFNEITKIDSQSGSIIWRLGGNENQFTFINDPLKFKRQHDIRRLANGNISLFDNGDGNYGSPFHPASGKEYQLDEQNLTATLVWEYVDDSSEFSPAMGNFQRKPGGPSLLSYGITSSANKVFNVVDDNGFKVFEIAFDDTLRSYRVFHYESLPWAVNRPQVVCLDSLGQFYLDAGPGHSSYYWSTGDTTRLIPLAATGSYSVFVPKGEGGFLQSKPFHVYNMADPCGVSGYGSTVHRSLEVFPNPVTDRLKVHAVAFNPDPVRIFSYSGQLVYESAHSVSGTLVIPVDHWPDGVYTLRCGDYVKKIVKL